MTPQNTVLRAIFTSAIFASVPLLHAQDAAPAKEIAPEKDAAPAQIYEDTLKELSPNELRSLVQLSGLPPEKLTALRKSIEMLEKMTPADKAALKARLEKLQNANERERQNYMHEANERRFNNNLLLFYWRSLPPENSKAEQEKFKKMNDKERREYVETVRKKMPPPQMQQRPNGERSPGWQMPPPRPKTPAENDTAEKK